MEATVVTTYSLRSSLYPDVIDLKDIDKIDNQYDVLYIGDILCMVPNEEIGNTLTKIKSKVKLGGRIVIEQFDLYELMLGALNENLSSTDFNNIIAPRQRLFFIYEITHLLSQLKFKILSKDIDNYRQLIEVQCLN